MQDAADIIISPQSVNISSGDHAVFNCTAIATDLNWKVNDDSFNTDYESKGFHELAVVVLDASQSLRTASLRVLGSAHSNNASIVCVAILEYSQLLFVGNKSEPALLLVQGILCIMIMIKLQEIS